MEMKMKKKLDTASRNCFLKPEPIIKVICELGIYAEFLLSRIHDDDNDDEDDPRAQLTSWLNDLISR